MPRITYNSGAIAAGTYYLRNDGTLSTNANDGAWWIPKGSAPALLQGLLVGGTSVVTIQKGDRERVTPGSLVPPGTPPATNISVVDEETPNLAASLSAGLVQDIGSPYLRVKLVQSVGSTTAQLLVLTV